MTADDNADVSQSFPSITADIQQAIEDIKAFGICRVSGLLTQSQLQRAREALQAAAEYDRDHQRETGGLILDNNDRNQRVWNLLSRDSIFCELAEHPVALQLAKSIIGWPVLISNYSANITYPGAVSGMSHTDQGFVPEPWPEDPQTFNTTWCLDPFTTENGATEFVVGSHLDRALYDDGNLVPATAPAGTLLAFDGRMWHRSGANVSSNQQRMAILGYYTKTIYRTNENWFLTLGDGFLDSASDDMLTMLAYKNNDFSGLVFGRNPR